MGAAGTWISFLWPMIQGLIEDIISVFKKPTPAPGEEGLVAPRTAAIIAFVMRLLPSIVTLTEEGIALFKAEPGVALPQEVKDKVGGASKLLADLAQALTGLDALASTVKVLQEMSDVLAALAA